MRFRKWYACLFMTIVFILIVYLLVQSIQSERLPNGSDMPRIGYQDRLGFKTLAHDSSKMTMIILFHLDCNHCRYQLKRLNDGIDQFHSVILFLFTTDQYFFGKDKNREYPMLMDEKHVIWGIVDPKEFQQKYGSVATPTTFIFNKSGILIHKIRGEVRLERIIDYLSFNK